MTRTCYLRAKAVHEGAFAAEMLAIEAGYMMPTCQLPGISIHEHLPHCQLVG